jgi:hypothetical protein
MRHRKVG